MASHQGAPAESGSVRLRYRAAPCVASARGALTTWLRPCCFASYIAASARVTQAATVSPGRTSATPTERSPRTRTPAAQDWIAAATSSRWSWPPPAPGTPFRRRSGSTGRCAGPTGFRRGPPSETGKVVSTGRLPSADSASTGAATSTAMSSQDIVLRVSRPDISASATAIGPSDRQARSRLEGRSGAWTSAPGPADHGDDSPWRWAGDLVPPGRQVGCRHRARQPRHAGRCPALPHGRGSLRGPR